MALYEYNLFLFREASMGPLLPELKSTGIIGPAGEDSGYIFGKIRCDFQERRNDSDPSTPLQVVTIWLQDNDVNALLREDPAQLIDGLWKVAEETKIVYAFIGASSDATYFEIGKLTMEQVLSQVGRIVKQGQVEIVHPVMFFAERVGNGRVCAIAKGAPRYTLQTRPGVGCLLMLTAQMRDGTTTIEEPGVIYPALATYFRNATSGGSEQAPANAG